MDAKKAAEVIAKELMYNNEEDKQVLYENIARDSCLAVEDLKVKISEEVEKILEKNNYNVIY